MTPEPAALRLRLLGIATLAMAAGPALTLSRKDAALLARLALDGRQTRTLMAAWLWPGVPMPRAHANLRQRLFRLRQAGAALVEETADGLQLQAAVAVDLDSADADFDAPLLASLASEDDAVQDWLDDARRRWLARRVDRMSGLASRLEAAGALAPALALTERLLALEPLLEHGWRRLMRLHVQRGDRAAAVSAFERCERVLRDELGLAPSPETQALLARVESMAEAGPPARSPLQLPSALLRPPRLVGRTHELRAMALGWQAGQAFLVLGEPGLGKSRLLAEFAAGAPGVLLVGALPGDEHVPYAVLLRLLRRLAASGAALWPEGAARQELARLLPELGPPPAAPGLEALLRAAIMNVFERAASAGWAGVIVDDLQQADHASAAILRAAAVAGTGLRWGFGSRPDTELPTWSRSSARVLELALAPLSSHEAGALIDSLGLNPPPDTALQARLLRHCGGNPLFLLETLKQLALDPGAAAAAMLPLPASIENAVSQRLAQLSAPALALLRVAALGGAEFHPEVAAEVLGRPVLALADAWREAETAQLLRPDGFAHDALRHTVLAGLPSPLRAALHERIAFALQRRSVPAVAVARHFEAAGVWPAAGRMARQAAADALRLGLGAEGLARLADAERFFTAAAEPANAFEAALAAVPVHLAQHGPALALARADALQSLALDATQRVALAQVRAEAALGGYQFALAAEAATAALAEAVPGSSDELLARLLQAAALAMLSQPVPGRPEQLSLRRRIDALVEPLQAAVAWSHWALIQHAAGRRGDCIEALQSQRRHAHAAGHAALEAEALASLGGQLNDVGDVAPAIRTSGQAATLLRRLGDLQTARAADMNHAIALIGADRLADALQVLDADTHAGADIDGIATDLRAEVWLRAGEATRALTALGEAPLQGTLARRINHSLLQAQAVMISGDGERAAAQWRALARLLPPVQSSGVAFRAAALCSVVLPPAEARVRLDALVQIGGQHGVPAIAGLARLRRAACAWRDGDRRTALADVHWLLAQRPRLCHLYLPQAELLALSLRILAAAGRTGEAEAVRQQACTWFTTELQPQLPAGSEAAWRMHPAWCGLLEGGILPTSTLRRRR